jgi:hypothetical protein
MPENRKENPIVRMLAIPFIVLWGLAFIISAFWSPLREGINSWIGEVNFLFLGVGFLFFYTAVLVAEKNLMRSRFLNILEEMQEFFLGKGHKQKIEAVGILIDALERGNEDAATTAARELRRLTGQDFGTHHEQWNTWWADNREAYLQGRKRFPVDERKNDDSSG